MVDIHLSIQTTTIQCNEEVWATVKDIAKKELSNKKLLRSRCILWSKQGYTYGSSFHR